MSESEQYLSPERAGFERAGVSNIYHKGLFAVRVNPDGTKNLFVDFEDTMNWSGVISIKQGSKFGAATLMALDKTGRFISCTPGGGGHYGSDGPSEMRNATEPIRQQLKNAGFGENEIDSAVLTRMFPRGDEQVELMAVMNGEKLIRVFKPIRPSTAKVLGNKFEVVGYREEKAEFGGRTNSVIEVENDSITFQISSFTDGMIKEDSQRLKRRVSEDELGIKPREVVGEESGFQIGGVNSTELIRSLSTINNISIKQLEKRMRPHNSSMVGFLGERESLLEVLANDNDYVRGLGLTHQQIAAPLIYARQHVLSGRGNSFIYEGETYTAEYTGWRGIQDSPFEDGTKTSVDIKIINPRTGKQIHFSGLLPDMIQRYGFYEGKETHYRLEPSSVVEVFDFLSKK